MNDSSIKIRLETVSNVEQEAAAARVRREVFGTDWAVELCRVLSDEQSRASHLIARVLPEQKVIAALTVLDTTGNETMHLKHGLDFGKLDRVARYTHMAVLRPYHGLKLPLYMFLEASRRYVVPGGFAYTWLSLPSHRAASSTFRRMLRFSVAPGIVDGEQGPCRVLRRREGTAEARAADMSIRSFLDRVQPRRIELISTYEQNTPLDPADDSSEYSVITNWHAYPRLARHDEWLAQ